jgi:hypothetical protein
MSLSRYRKVKRLQKQAVDVTIFTQLNNKKGVIYPNYAIFPFQVMLPMNGEFKAPNGFQSPLTSYFTNISITDLRTRENIGRVLNVLIVLAEISLSALRKRRFVFSAHIITSLFAILSGLFVSNTVHHAVTKMGRTYSGVYKNPRHVLYVISLSMTEAVHPGE